MEKENYHPIFPIRSARKSIYATLAFFDIFDYPLTLNELTDVLLGELPSESHDVEATLTSDPLIEMKGPYFYLRGREKIINTRHEHEQTAAKYWKRVKKIVPLLQMVPFVQMVAVCNTLAFNNPNKESDIDLFIVVKHGRLMLARMLSTILFSILGVRRHGSKITERFCLSFYVTDQNLNLEKIQSPDDIYLAYWVAVLQPILGEKMYQNFLAQNSWVKKFFRHDLKPNLKKLQKNSWLISLGKAGEFILKGKIGDFFEKKLWNWQRKRHQQNEQNLGLGSSVIINENMLKFHNIDRRQEFSEKFRKKFSELVASSQGDF